MMKLSDIEILPPNREKSMKQKLKQAFIAGWDSMDFDDDVEASFALWYEENK